MLQGFVKYYWYHQVSSCITRYHEGSKKHIDGQVPNIDFVVLHSLGNGSSVSGIRSDCIQKYMSKS